MHINEENDEKIVDDLSMHEALTENSFFNSDEEFLPCKCFSESLKQHEKIINKYVCHLHKNDLPRYLVVLAHHNHLSGKAHNRLLEQEVQMCVKFNFFIRGLKRSH